MYHFVTVSAYLAVMCIFVIYKRLSWDGNQHGDLADSQAKLSIGSC
jgi:hypothetical protein